MTARAGNSRSMTGTGHQLGDPSAAFGLAVERSPVEALDHRGGVVGEQRAEQADHEVGPEVGHIAVDEGHEVAFGLVQGDPHGLALAPAGRIAADHPGAGLRGDGTGAVGRAVVHHHHFVDQGHPAAAERQGGHDPLDDRSDGGRLVAGRNADRHHPAGLGRHQSGGVELGVVVDPRRVVVRGRCGHDPIFPHRGDAPLRSGHVGERRGRHRDARPSTSLTGPLAVGLQWRPSSRAAEGPGPVTLRQPAP